MKIKRIGVPPLEFGHSPLYFETRSFSLAGLNKGLHITPRIAKPYQSYYLNKGVTTVAINGGAPEYTAIPRNRRSVILDSGYIQDANGQKHWKDYTQADAKRAARYAWEHKGGYGLITSQAQEGRGIPGGDPWAQHHNVNGNAYKWLSQEWGVIMAENPGISYGGCYDGPNIFNPRENPNTLRTALSTDANALAYLIATQKGANPYWSEGLYQYHDLVLNLYYRNGKDTHAKFFELQMILTLAKMALRGLGFSNRRVIIYVFTGKSEFVDIPNEGYSEKYVNDLPGGGTQFEYTFPEYSPNHHWELGFCGLDLGDDYYGWEDNDLFGLDPTKIIKRNVRWDGFVTRDRSGGNVTEHDKGPNPYNPSALYPINAHHNGLHDIAPCAAEMYEEVARYAGQNSQFARHRPAGSANWCSLDSGYLVDRYVNREATVRVARQGTRGWLKITDCAAPYTFPYDLQVDLFGGTTGVFPVDSNTPNLFTFDTSL